MIALSQGGWISRLCESLTMGLRAQLCVQGFFLADTNAALPGIAVVCEMYDTAAGAVRNMQLCSNSHVGSRCHAPAACLLCQRVVGFPDSLSLRCAYGPHCVLKGSGRHMNAGLRGIKARAHVFCDTAAWFEQTFGFLLPRLRTRSRAE